MNEELIAKKKSEEKDQFVSLIIKDGEIEQGMYILQCFTPQKKKRLVEYDRRTEEWTREEKEDRLKEIMEAYIEIEKPIRVKEELLTKLDRKSEAVQVIDTLLNELKQRIQEKNQKNDVSADYKNEIRLLKNDIEKYNVEGYRLIIKTENNKSELIGINNVLNGKEYVSYQKDSMSEMLWDKLEGYALSLIPQEEREAFYEKFPDLKRKKQTKEKDKTEMEDR